MKLNIFSKFLQKPSEISDSRIEVSVDSEPSDSELFDGAVKEVLKNRLTESIKLNLIKSLHTKEQYEDTEAAVKYCIEFDEPSIECLNKLYPNNVMKLKHGMYSSGWVAEYSDDAYLLNKLISTLVDDYLDKNYKGMINI